MEADAIDDQYDLRATKEESSSRPAARFGGTGGLNVAAWMRKTDGVDRFSIRLDRSYKDDSGDYQNTPYLWGLCRRGRTLGSLDRPAFFAGCRLHQLEGRRGAFGAIKYGLGFAVTCFEFRNYRPWNDFRTDKYTI